jgi:hypothetical protein
MMAMMRLSAAIELAQACSICSHQGRGFKSHPVHFLLRGNYGIKSGLLWEVVRRKPSLYYRFGLFNLRFHRSSHTKKIVEASQQMLKVNSQGEGMNPAIKRHFELEIKTLQTAPRKDADKLERLLQVNQRQKE